MAHGQKERPLVRLAHGSGGEASRKLIREMVLPRFDNPPLRVLGDSAVLDFPRSGSLAFTTDSYVIDPIFFPGGDIGYLAVCGTVNDLAVSGARPLWLSAGLILEEGLPLEDLERVLDSMARAASLAGVDLVTGDIKVVARGAADKMFINTAGVGLVPRGLALGPDKCRPGDAVIVSGPVGSHGIAVLAARQDLGFETDLQSDVAPLDKQVRALLEACPEVRMMRDPTRGGLATALNEIADSAGVGMELSEADIPVTDAVRGACEILGFDPLFIANEGAFLAILPERYVPGALKALRKAGAPRPSLIGKVTEKGPPGVCLITVIGGKRIVEPMGDELLPRIC